MPRQLHVLDDVPPERRLQGGLGFHAQGFLRRSPPPDLRQLGPFRGHRGGPIPDGSPPVRPTPDTSKLVPSGALKTTLIANFVNLGFFGIGCKFFTAPFIDMYIPGVVAGINKGSPDAMEAIYLIMSNAGMCMLMNIVSALMVLAAEPGNADTNYRIQRAWLYTNFVYLGMLSRRTSSPPPRAGRSPCLSRPSCSPSP